MERDAGESVRVGSSIKDGGTDMEIWQSSVVTPVLVLLRAMNLLGCGGGSSSRGSTGPPNPAPAIDAISPNSSQQGGPSFTLSVVGSNFISDSSVQWNGSNLPTTFVSNALLTAAVPASAIAAPGPDAVTVVNPAPGGGASAMLNFAVPCVIPCSAPASGQTSARLGAYYFDGWSGPRFHFFVKLSCPRRFRSSLATIREQLRGGPN